MGSENSPAITARLAAAVLGYVEDAGGSSARVAMRARLPRAIGRRSAFLSADQVNTLLRCAGEEIADPHIGLSLGASMDLRVMGTISYVVVNAPIVATALGNLVRYQASFTRGFNCFYESGTRVSTGFRLPGKRNQYPELEQLCVSIVIKTLRSLVGRPWRSDAVAFRHDPPARSIDYLPWLNCEPDFGQRRTALVITRETADEVIPFADRQLLPMMEQRLRTLWQNEDQLIAELCSLIAESLCDGTPNIDNIARACEISTRTLQRRLTQNGTSFRALLTEVRKQLAKNYLCGSNADLLEIALLLGYADQSALSHAFVNWYGQTPSAYRSREAASG